MAAGGRGVPLRPDAPPVLGGGAVQDEGGGCGHRHHVRLLELPRGGARHLRLDGGPGPPPLRGAGRCPGPPGVPAARTLGPLRGSLRRSPRLGGGRHAHSPERPPVPRLCDPLLRPGGGPGGGPPVEGRRSGHRGPAGERVRARGRWRRPGAPLGAQAHRPGGGPRCARLHDHGVGRLRHWRGRADRDGRWLPRRALGVEPRDEPTVGRLRVQLPGVGRRRRPGRGGRRRSRRSPGPVLHRRDGRRRASHVPAAAGPGAGGRRGRRWARTAPSGS